nr:DUF6338 family protein [uncultured Undibacterium sp.]
MPDISKDLILLLQYLLPGFLVAWVYYGLTSHLKPSQFERVVQALIYAMVVKIVVVAIQSLCLFLGSFKSFGNWTADTDLIVSALSALMLGIFFSHLTVKDTFHRWMRTRKITKRSGNPSEWYAALDNYPRFIVLHLKGNRRLFGWPHLWPSDSEKGHFFMTNISWLEQNEEGENRIKELESLDGILVNVNEVELIEFLTEPENKDGN